MNGAALPRWALPASVYLASAAWVLRGSVGRAVGEGIDLTGTLWFHGFVVNCLATLTLPTHTSAFFAPEGKDIFADTGANVLDAMLAAPFLAAIGSPGYLAPFVAVVLVGNAVAMHTFLRSLGLSTAAVIAGSVAWSFAPSLLHELDGGRPTQALLWFWPLALRALVRMREDPRWIHPILGGFFVALQAWTYWFTGHFFAVAFAPALLLWGFVQADRGRWLPRLGAAGFVAVLAVAPAAVPMALRLAHGAVSGAGLKNVVPALDPDAWWILAPWASNLPIPTWWLVVLGIGLLGCRNRILWGTAAGLGLLLVAGPRLAIGQSSITNPVWWAASVLPGLDRLLFPARAWPVLAFCGAAALAETVDRLRSKGVVATGLVAAALVVAVHAAHPARLRSTAVPVPAYAAEVAKNPGIVLDLPYPCGHFAIHLQALHGQPLFGGMAEHIAALRPPGVDARIAASPSLQALIAAAKGEKVGLTHAAPPVRWVVLHSDIYRNPLSRICLTRAQQAAGSAAVASLETLLGPPTVQDAHATAWDLGTP